MFRKSLADNIQKIFGVKKVTFDAPSDSYEQDTIFIEIQEAKPKMGKNRASARVVGQLVIFSEYDKMPFGFFSKRIEHTDNSFKKDLFFYDIDVNQENSPARLQNISERRASFVYFFTAQYDPSRGQLTSLETTEG